MKKKKIVMLGIQGSGKGTQAIILSEKYHIPHISTGDIFRDAIKNQTELGKKFKACIDAGELVDDKIVDGIIHQRLLEKDCENGFILDGYPRTGEQARALEKFEGHVSPNLVLDIELTDDEAHKRATGRRMCGACQKGYNVYTAPKPKKGGVCDACGGKLVTRSDDTENAVRERISEYHHITEPIKKHYRELNVLVKIEGMDGIDAVSERIFAIISQKFP